MPTDSPGHPATLLWEISRADDEPGALARATQLVAMATGAQRCVVMSARGPAIERGFAGAGPPMDALRDAIRRDAEQAMLGEWGEHAVCAVALDGDPPAWLIACRAGEPFSPGDRERLTTIAHVLAMTLALLRSGRVEDELRREHERESAQRAAAERELEHQARHDRLTGLPNRDLILDRATRLLGRVADGGDRLMAMVVIDVDGFKAINDSLGLARGDRLLAAVAQRLETVMAELESAERSVALGRYGPDEFLLLGARLSGERDVMVISERVREALAPPVELGDRELAITVSIGVSCTGAERAETGRTAAEHLVSDAEEALLRAKELGGDRAEIFDERMRARLLDEALMEADLRAGLQRGELLLLYQPVVTVTDCELTAVEALVRWEHPVRGRLGPGEFIALAERSDLIVELGGWVIDEACAQIRRWREGHPARLGVRVSVNVSARQLCPQLIEVVADALARHGVDPAQLALEITETLLVERTAECRELLHGLAGTGVSIVLDDFGTGYSSLGYLKEFPLHQLKLDRTFCAELDGDLRSAKIVAATIEMARALGMTIVAEGVETPEQLTVLRRLGCDFAQGFWFARPEEPAAIFERLLAAYEADRQLAQEFAGPAPVTTSAGAAIVERRRGDDRRRAAGRRVSDVRRSIASHRRPGAGARSPGAGRADLARLAAEALPASPRDSAQIRAAHRRSLGRMTGLLFLTGAVAAIPADLVAHAPALPAAILLTLMGLVTGTVCLALPWQRLSEGWLHAAAVLGTLEITVSVVVDGRHGTMLVSFYGLVATAVAYGFRDRRAIGAQTLLILVAMVAPPLLGSDQPSDAVPRVLVGVFVTAGIVAAIVYLRERLERSAACLRELAERDPLTDVGNYRMLHERLEDELALHRVRELTMAVLLIDLDRFKEVNERLGHAAGDDVLRRVARTLCDAVRDEDTVARQGGDEFAVLAPHTDAEGAAMLAGRLRQRLRRVQFAGEAVDATIGWAVYPVDGATAEALLAHADSRLLGSKRTGGRAGLPLG